MTIQKLVDILESMPVSPDTEVLVDTPDDTGYFEDTHNIYGVCVTNSDKVFLKCWWHEKEGE